MQLGSVLHAYKGEYGLPSIDFECIRAMCLVKFGRYRIDIETNTSPFRSGEGKLPFLQIGNEKYVGYRQIKQVLEKKKYYIDINLNSKQKQLSATYTNWVFTNLHGYYNYFMYGEPNNFDSTTRALYAKRTPFPFNFYYPSRHQREASDIVNIFGGFDINDKIDKHECEALVINAKKCVNSLSKLLGRKVWFFGNYYSEFDAIVYAYLAIILQISLPNNPLQNHIKGCQNLVYFINRINKDIFKNEAFSSVKLAKSAATPYDDPNITPSERNFLESEKNTKIFAGFAAIIAMAGFAAWRGLYGQLSFKRGDYANFDYDDDDDDDDNADMN